jgi:hypothetical protein
VSYPNKPGHPTCICVYFGHVIRKQFRRALRSNSDRCISIRQISNKQHSATVPLARSRAPAFCNSTAETFSPHHAHHFCGSHRQVRATGIAKLLRISERNASNTTGSRCATLWPVYYFSSPNTFAIVAMVPSQSAFLPLMDLRLSALQSTEG